jgi:hypothetical protein
MEAYARQKIALVFVIYSWKFRLSIFAAAPVGSRSNNFWYILSGRSAGGKIGDIA